MFWQDIRVWLNDPERFWQRLAVISLGVAVVLAVAVVNQHGSGRRWRAQITELKRLNDRQREVVAEIGGQLTDVRAEMTALVDKLDKLAPSGPPVSEPAVAETSPPPAEAGGVEDRHSLVADLNRDGIVDWQDFDLFAKDWGQTGDRQADLYKDYVVDWRDFDIFADQWLKTEPWYHPKGSG